MPRNRVIYQTQALFTGPYGELPATGSHYSNNAQPQLTGTLIKELLRIQSANYSFNKTLTDVNQYNQLANISREVLQEPTVSLDFSYIQANLTNERLMGFHISSGAALVSALSGILTKRTDEKNYFIKTVGEGVDALSVGPSQSASTIGIGQGFISNYTAEGSVGNFPVVSVRLEAANMNFDATTSGAYIPAVNPSDGAQITSYTYCLPASVTNASGVNGGEITITALKPGDIVLDLGTYTGVGAAVASMKVQNYSISADLARDPLRQLGTKFPFSREIRFPASVGVSVTAEVGDLNAGSLINLLSSAPHNLTIRVYRPDTTSRIPANEAVVYVVKGAELESQSFSSSVGSNQAVTLNFTSQISGPNQTSIGLFMSGVN